MDTIELGKVWDLIPRRSSYDPHFSANRYDPPEPEQEEMIIFRLLQMFHKKPFLLTRFPPQGTSLTLRARNENFLDIIIRFKINLNYFTYFF